MTNCYRREEWTAQRPLVNTAKYGILDHDPVKGEYSKYTFVCGVSNMLAKPRLRNYYHAELFYSRLESEGYLTNSYGRIVGILSLVRTTTSVFLLN